MSRATVELDFFGLERDNQSSSKSQFQKFLHRQRSFRGIQSAISKINPEVLKSVLNQKPDNAKQSFSVPSSPKSDQILFPSLPVYVPNAATTTRPSSENLHKTAPMTIFYNGSVSVFDVPKDKVESILKIAIEGSRKSNETVEAEPCSSHQTQLLYPLNGDLPIARSKSLQRFLEKRKERLTSVSPYSCHT